MRLAFLFIICGGLAISGCHSQKNTTTAATAQASSSLEGTWVLDVIPYPQASIDSLYKQQRPELTFDLATQRFSGFTGCNRINGPLVCDDAKINFQGDIAMTKMACFGDGEPVFMENLKKINKYSVSADGNTLNLIKGDIALMRFHKK